MNETEIAAMIEQNSRLRLRTELQSVHLIQDAHEIKDYLNALKIVADGSIPLDQLRTIAKDVLTKWETRSL